MLHGLLIVAIVMPFMVIHLLLAFSNDFSYSRASTDSVVHSFSAIAELLVMDLFYKTNP